MNKMGWVLFGLTLFVVLDVLYPFKKPAYHLKVGDIVKKDIIAPFDFPIFKDKQTLQKERDEAVFSTPPVLRLVRNEKEVSNFFKNIRYPGKRLEKLIKDIINKGIVFDKSRLPPSRGDMYEIVSAGKTKFEKKSDFYSYTEAKDTVLKICKKVFRDSLKVEKFFNQVNYLIQPNLLLDITKTEAKRTAARRSVPEEFGVIKKGEIIARAHDIVTEETYRKLRSFYIAQKKLSRPAQMHNFLSAQITFSILIFLLIFALYKRKKNIYIEWRHRFIFIIMVFFILLLARISPSPQFYYLIPLSAAAMVLTLEGGITVGFSFNIFVIIVLLIYNIAHTIFYIPIFMSGIIASVLVEDVKNRGEFFKIGLYISIFTGLFVLGVSINNGEGVLLSFSESLLGFANGIISILILFGLLSFFEKVFNISTNFTYLELANLNQPLLMQLSAKAPGTYHHSILVGNLAEAGAEAIGANSLLAKVGGYYHDIGKMERPEYFIENIDPQFNPHNDLPPKLSAAILRSHISFGVELGAKYKLPNEILKIIREHHGSTLMKPFFERAKEMYDNVKPEDYSYVGPPPSFKESCIIMLADSIEAGTRSLENTDEKTLKEFISKIFEMKLVGGQLINSGISIRDLKNLQDVFFGRIQGTFHTRPSYPK